MVFVGKSKAEVEQRNLWANIGLCIYVIVPPRKRFNRFRGEEWYMKVMRVETLSRAFPPNKYPEDK